MMTMKKVRMNSCFLKKGAQIRLVFRTQPDLQSWRLHMRVADCAEVGACLCRGPHRRGNCRLPGQSTGSPIHPGHGQAESRQAAVKQAGKMCSALGR